MFKPKSTLFAVACLIIGSAPIAATQPTQEQSEGMACNHSSHNPHHGHRMGMMRVLKQLHQLPNLSGEQHTAIDALIKQAESHHKPAETKKPEDKKSNTDKTLSAPEQINHHIEWQEKHLQQAKTFQEDFKRFYDGLNSDQKTKADELFNRKHERRQLIRDKLLGSKKPHAE